MRRWRREAGQVAAEGFASQLEGVAVRAQETLTELGYSWALIGGLAVSARARDLLQDFEDLTKRFLP